MKMSNGMRNRYPGWLPELAGRAGRWIFPPGCGVCDEPLSFSRQSEKPFLCEVCEAKLTPMGENACRICGQSYGDAVSSGFVFDPFRCSNCADRDLAIDFSISSYRSSGECREMMHAYKYGKQIHLARTWGSLLQRVWENPRMQECPGWHLIPVPLHRKRFRERGFNQAAEIAREFARQSPQDKKLLVSPCLKRTKHTVRQAQLDRKERFTNLSNVFALRSSSFSHQEGFGFLIVDDVITTATTVSECARILRESDLETPLIGAVSVLRG